MDGRVRSRCGSPESNACFAAVRPGDTAQLLLAIHRAPSGSTACEARDGNHAVAASATSVAPLSGAPGGGSGWKSMRAARCPFGWIGSWIGSASGNNPAAAALPTRADAAARSNSLDRYASVQPIRPIRWYESIADQRGRAPRSRNSSGSSLAGICAMYAFTPSAYARANLAEAAVSTSAANFCCAARGRPSRRISRSSGSARAPATSVSRPEAAMVCR